MVLGIPKKTLVIFAVLIGVVLIYAMGSDQRPSEAQSGSDGEDCRVKVTADILNVRAGPGMAAEIVGKLRQEAETEAQPVVRNGFRKIDDSRWAADAFLEPVSGASCG